MKPDRAELEAILIKLVASEFSGIDFQVSLIDQLNSLQLLSFALMVQKAFSIPIADVEITERNFSSLERVVDFVERRLSLVQK